jgi:hypothetical protein
MAKRIITATGASAPPANEGTGRAGGGGNVLPFDQSRRRSGFDDLFIPRRRAPEKPLEHGDEALFRGEERVRIVLALHGTPAEDPDGPYVGSHGKRYRLDPCYAVSREPAAGDKAKWSAPFVALASEITRAYPTHLRLVDEGFAPSRKQGRGVARRPKAEVLVR